MLLSREAALGVSIVQPQLEPSADGPSTLGSLRIKMRVGPGLLLMRCAPPAGYNTQVRVSPAAERIRPLNRAEKMARAPGGEPFLSCPAMQFSAAGTLFREGEQKGLCFLVPFSRGPHLNRLEKT
jgi:hypothetical protein